MAELFTKKDMRYGGNPSDYYTLYEHVDSGKMFKNLADARGYAIEYCIKQHERGNRVTNRDGNYYDTNLIDARLFYKSKPEGGVGLAYSFQSGKTKNVGYVYVRNPSEIYWRPNNKKDSAWLNRDGRVKRKMTRKEIEEKVW